MTSEEIREADDDAICELVDPLIMSCASKDVFRALRPEERALVTVWLLNTIVLRNGLSAFVAEEPPWLTDHVASAARALELDTLDQLAELWEQATTGMDLSKERGKVPADVTWGAPHRARELEHFLMHGTLSNFTEVACEWIRAHAEAFDDES